MKEDRVVHNDDETTGRWLTRREVVALCGASALAAAAHRIGIEPALAQGLPNCVVHPQQTEGPFFVDEKLLRSDVRTEPATGVAKPGAPFELNLALSQVGADGRCTPLPGAQVDIWQCDAIGEYSDARDRTFNTTGQKFLRGHQVSDTRGHLRFTTIYPGWYPGRAVHIHFKVRSTAENQRGYEFTSQLYFDESLTDRVHAREPYAAHKGRRMRNDDDFIFRDGGKQMMLPVTERQGKYAANFGIGVQLSEPRRRSRWRSRG